MSTSEPNLVIPELDLDITPELEPIESSSDSLQSDLIDICDQLLDQLDQIVIKNKHIAIPFDQIKAELGQEVKYFIGCTFDWTELDNQNYFGFDNCRFPQLTRIIIHENDLNGNGMFNDDYTNTPFDLDCRFDQPLDLIFVQPGQYQFHPSTKIRSIINGYNLMNISSETWFDPADQVKVTVDPFDWSVDLVDTNSTDRTISGKYYDLINDYSKEFDWLLENIQLALGLDSLDSSDYSDDSTSSDSDCSSQVNFNIVIAAESKYLTENGSYQVWLKLSDSVDQEWVVGNVTFNLIADDSFSRALIEAHLSPIKTLVHFKGDVPDDWYKQASNYAQVSFSAIKDLTITGHIGARAWEEVRFNLDSLTIKGSIGKQAFKYADGRIGILITDELSESSWDEPDIVIDDMILNQIEGRGPFIWAKVISLYRSEDIRYVKWAKKIIIQKHFTEPLDLTHLNSVNWVDFRQVKPTPPFKIISSSTSSENRVEVKQFYHGQPSQWFRSFEKDLTIVYQIDLSLSLIEQQINLSQQIRDRLEVDLKRAYDHLSRLSYEYRVTEQIIKSNRILSSIRNNHQLECRVKCSDDHTMTAFRWSLKLIELPSLESVKRVEPSSDESEEETRNYSWSTYCLFWGITTLVLSELVILLV